MWSVSSSRTGRTKTTSLVTEKKTVYELLADSVKFVLVGTTHPGNIGASARAIKTMGLSKLFLVNPKDFPNDDCPQNCPMD